MIWKSYKLRTGCIFHLKTKKRKEKKRKKGLGKINKIIWGSTNGLLVKSLKVKANVDSFAIVLAGGFRNLAPFVLNKL